MATSKVILTKPGDVLIIGNVGPMTQDGMQRIRATIETLKETLGLAMVIIFEDDIDMAMARTAINNQETT